MNLNQWRSTKTVNDWFTGIRNKHLHKSVIFDNKKFDPSITKNLLKKHHTPLSQMMIKQLLTTQENHYPFKTSKL